MEIDNYNSRKISFISFWMIVMVVYIHNYYLEARNFIVPNLIQLTWSNITSVAVPMFYAISGYLYFNNIKQVKDCGDKIKKRIKTLLIPYVIWNVIFVLWFVVLEIIPWTRQYLNSDIFSNLKASDLPIGSFIFLFIKPAGFQMWFLRDLLLFVMLSPILFLLMKYAKWGAFFICVLLTGWLERFWIGSFILGGLLSMYTPKYIDYFRNKNRGVVVICLLIYCLYSLIAPLNIIQFNNLIISRYFVQLYIIIPMMAIWGLYDIFSSKKPETWLSCFLYNVKGYSFFIYLSHEPVLNIIKKLGIKFIGLGDWQLVVLYFFNPIIMVLILVAVARVLKKTIPYSYSVMVGGRV